VSGGLKSPAGTRQPWADGLVKKEASSQMSSQYSGCAEILVYPLAALGRWAAPAIDETAAQVRAAVGDRGCFVLLVAVALLALILPILLFDLGWEWLVLLGGFLALIVIGVGSSYRLGAGGRSGSNNGVDSDRRKAMSGPELISRYQAGERDFRGASLRSAMLLHLDLSGVDLSGANLRDAQLDRTELRGAILFDADLRGADLQRANLTGASLVGANLEGARLINANMRGANLVGANLEHAKLVGADLVDADLGGADLDGANLDGANLWRADLDGANLVDADLGGVNLTGANLTRATVTDEQLSGARSLEGATLPDGTVHE
jgi:uncharacterized protein YjbI with pentapeptide repeats